MSLLLAMTLCTLFATMAGAMLSGSPVPAVLSIVLLLIASILRYVSRRWFRPRYSFLLLFIAIAIAATGGWVQAYLFKEDLALATRADWSPYVHWGITLLWAAFVLGLIDSRGDVPQQRSICESTSVIGSLLLLAGTAATHLYDFSPWEVYPIAAFPLATSLALTCFSHHSVLNSLVRIILPLTLAFTLIFQVSTKMIDSAEGWLSGSTDESSEASSEKAPDVGTAGPIGDGASRHLPRKADIQFRNVILVSLRAHSPELFRSWLSSPLYLRTSTLSLFESDEILSPIRSGRWIYDLDDGEEDGLIPLRLAKIGESPDLSKAHTFYLRREGISHIPLLANTAFLFASGVYEFADDWFQVSMDEQYQHLRYTASTSPTTYTQVTHDDLSKRRYDEISSIYLQLPPSPLNQEIEQISKSFRRGDSLSKIRQWFEEHTSYSLQFNTPEGSSPIADFLFGQRQGHCEHYAAATVLILRQLGIPSRVAYGYAGGLADSKQSIVSFRDSDFHAWAEILTPEGDWKPFDTTPRVVSAAPRSVKLTTLPLVDDGAFHNLSDFAPNSQTLTHRLTDWITDLIDALPEHFVLSLAGSVMLILKLWSLLNLKRRRREQAHERGMERVDPRRHTLPILHEVETIGRQNGHERRPGETWHEYLGKIGQGIPLPEVVKQAVEYHYRIIYAGKTPDPKVETELLMALRAYIAEGIR